MNLLKKIIYGASHAVFILTGRKPWSFGYSVYKRRKICEVLARGDFNPQTLPRGYGYRLDERIVEYPWFFSRLPQGKGRLLDAGSALNFDFLLKQAAVASKKLSIYTLAPESDCFCNLGISYIYGDLRETCYRDDYFDWIVSISTIEHAGMDNTLFYTNDKSKKEHDRSAYLAVVREFHRILKPGGTLYLTFPFGKREDHGWFQIFDGAMVNSLIEGFSPKSVKETYFRYEPGGWILSSREDSKDATYFDIHKQKSYDEDYAAASRAVAALEMVKP